jgi:hypothetical protein
MQYGVNDTDERHTAFDLFFSDYTVKDPNKDGLGGVLLLPYHPITVSKVGYNGGYAVSDG